MINYDVMKKIQGIKKRKEDLANEIESLNNAQRILEKGKPVEGMILQAHSKYKVILEEMDRLKNTDGAKYVSDIQSRNLYLVIQSHEVQKVVFKTPQRAERLRETSRILETNEEYLFIMSGVEFGKGLDELNRLNHILSVRIGGRLDEQGVAY